MELAYHKPVEYSIKLRKLLKSPLNIYNLGNPEQKRKFMKSMVENFIWNGSNLDLVWKKPFNLIAERPIFHNGRANREHWKTLFQDIYSYFIKNPTFIEFNMILGN